MGGGGGHGLERSVWTLWGFISLVRLTLQNCGCLAGITVLVAMPVLRDHLLRVFSSVQPQTLCRRRGHPSRGVAFGCVLK